MLSAMTEEISTGALAKALGVGQRTVWNAVRVRKDGRFDGSTLTPGGQLRWSVERARAIVVAFGRKVPETWKE
jgi:hypothetical protein